MNLLSNESFSYINYIFIFFIIIQVGLLFSITLIKRKETLINWFTVISASFISIVVSGLLLIFLGYAADEINLDVNNYTYMTIAIIVLSVINSLNSYKSM